MSDLFEYIKEHPLASIISVIVLLAVAAGVVANLGEFDIIDYVTNQFLGHLLEREPVIGMVDDRLTSLPDVKFEQIVCSGRPLEFEGAGVSC